MADNNTVRELVNQSSLRDYPLLESSDEALRALFRKDTNAIGIEELGRIILLDPGLTVKLLSAANQIPHKHLGTPMGAVQHAVMMLGLERIRTLFDGQPHLREKLEEEPLRRILDLYSRSHHAAVQATGWAQRRSDMNPGEVYVAAMLLRLGWMVLWVERPDEAAAVSAALAEANADPESGIEPEEVERAHLGFAVRELSAALAEAWDLPPLFREALDPALAGRQRVRTIRAADELAFNLDWNWYHQPITGQIWQVAELLHMPYHRAANAVHRDAAIAARAWRAYDIIPAAAALPDTVAQEGAEAPAEFDPLLKDKDLAAETYALAAEERTPPAFRRPELDAVAANHLEVRPQEDTPPHDLPEVRDEPEPEPGPSVEVRDLPEPEPGPTIEVRDQTEPEPPSAPVAISPDSDAIEQLFRVIDSSLTLPDAMHQVLHGLHHYVGLPRVIFAMLTADRTRLRARATLGGHDVERLAGAHVNMDTPHLFSKLMERPQAVWCRPDNSADLRPHIPATLADELDTDNFMAMSVFVNKRPVGLFYGDCGGAPCELSRQQFTLFSQLCNHASKTMTRLSTPKR